MKPTPYQPAKTRYSPLANKPLPSTQSAAGGHSGLSDAYLVAHRLKRQSHRLPVFVNSERERLERRFIEDMDKLDRRVAQMDRSFKGSVRRAQLEGGAA